MSACITSLTRRLQNLNLVLFTITRFSCRRQGASADKLHVKAARFLPLVGLARSKQDPINRGHGAQYLKWLLLYWSW